MKELLCVAPLMLLLFFQMASCTASTCEAYNLAAEPTPKYINAPDVTNLQDGNPCFVWYITTKQGAGSVYLDVTTFFVGSKYTCNSLIGSYVAIYDGPYMTSPREAIICGVNVYESSGYSMTIVFNASYPSHENFSLAYSSRKDYHTFLVPSCIRENLKADSSDNFFGSYSISLSQANRCHEWNISTKHGAGKVSLYLSSFRGTYQYSCTTFSSSFVAIYNGNDTTRNPDVILCGSQSAEYYLSNFSTMTVVVSPLFSGYFNFQYKSVGDNECTTQYLTAQTTDKYIKSSDLSKEKDDCYEWRITSANVSRLISLYLSSFSLWSFVPCKTSSSYMAIFDGSNTTFPQKAILCGYQSSNTYSSSSASMTVFYRTSDPHLDSFEIMYSTAESKITSPDNSIACKVVYLFADSFNQYFSSPDASSSPTGSGCYEWHISTTTSKQVSLHVSRLFVDAKSPCTTSSNSYLALYDGASTTSPEIAVLCGYHLTGTFLSSSSTLTVVYRSSDLSRDDFSFSYSFIEVSTKRSTFTSKTEAYTYQAPSKTLTIASIIAPIVGLISSAVSFACVHNRMQKQRLARAATTASVSSNMALNRDPSNSSLPTVSSPATFNNWRPSNWQLVDQNVPPATSSDSKIQLEEISSTASPFTTNTSGDTRTTPAPSPFPAFTNNLYTELDSGRQAGLAATGSVETPIRAAYTNTAVIDTIKAQK